MTTITKLLAFQFPARTEQLALVRARLRAVLVPLGASAQQTDCIVLAVSEGVMNIIQHTYQDDDGDILLEVEQQGDDLTFRLTDFARHKTCAAEMRSRPLDELRPGGLGCYLINEIMDDVKLVERKMDCGNVLQMKKCLPTQT